MKRALARKWITALESGLYPQTKYSLQDEKGLCCLGVLCSLHAEAHPEIAVKETSHKTYLGQGATLPEAVMSWSGVKNRAGRFGSAEVGGTTYVALCELNDSAGLTFPEIASVIRKHWKEL